MADLITLDEFKEYEGLSSSNDDLRLERIIPSVSQLVKTYCGNSIIDFYNTDKVEVFSIKWDTTIIQLTESPLVSVSLVEEKNSFNGEYVELQSNKYSIDYDTDSIFRIEGSQYRDWALGPSSVRVTYRAGYDEAPIDLKLAVIDLVNYYWRDEHKERRSIAGASIENQGVTGIKNSGNFPDHIQRVLDLYKTY